MEQSTVGELDRFGRALFHTGPTFDTVFRMDGGCFLSFHLIDLTGTDLYAVPATLAFFLINDGIHG